jgi:hypothetical protein
MCTLGEHESFCVLMSLSETYAQGAILFVHAFAALSWCNTIHLNFAKKTCKLEEEELVFLLC